MNERKKEFGRKNFESFNNERKSKNERKKEFWMKEWKKERRKVGKNTQKRKKEKVRK